VFRRMYLMQQLVSRLNIFNSLTSSLLLHHGYSSRGPPGYIMFHVATFVNYVYTRLQKYYTIILVVG